MNNFIKQLIVSWRNYRCSRGKHTIILKSEYPSVFIEEIYKICKNPNCKYKRHFQSKFHDD
jgi:hypothetical protein